MCYAASLCGIGVTRSSGRPAGHARFRDSLISRIRANNSPRGRGGQMHAYARSAQRARREWCAPGGAHRHGNAGRHRPHAGRGVPRAPHQACRPGRRGAADSRARRRDHPLGARSSRRLPPAGGVAASPSARHSPSASPALPSRAAGQLRRGGFLGLLRLLLLAVAALLTLRHVGLRGKTA